MNLNVMHISYSKIYRVGGVTFEWHAWCGPLIINRHTEKERQFKKHIAKKLGDDWEILLDGRRAERAA